MVRKRKDGQPAISIGRIISSGGNVLIAGRDVNYHLPPERIVTSPRQIPPPPQDFTGREKEIQELLASVEKRGVHILGLQGAGGIGKTTLAYVIADKLNERFPDQIRLDLRGTDTQPTPPDEIMRQVVHAYEPGLRLPENLDELKGLYWSILSGKTALLLFDNARDAAQLSPLLPLPAGCLALVTSRWRFSLQGLHPLHLDILSPDDAEKLLFCIAPEIGTMADELARLCDCLPIALRAAASLLIKNVNWDVQRLCYHLAAEQNRLKLEDPNCENLSVETILQTSVNLLPSKLKARWLRLAVFPVSFEEEAVAAVWEIEKDTVGYVLSELLSRSLLEFDTIKHRYRMHDLSRAYANLHLSPLERFYAEERHSRHFCMILERARELHMKRDETFLSGLGLLDQELANIKTGQAWAAANVNINTTAAELASDYVDAGAYILPLRLDPLERIHWIEAGLASAILTTDLAARGRHLIKLGNIYIILDEYQKAISFYNESLEIARLTGNRHGEGSVLNNLGSAYNCLGDYSKAIDCSEKSLIIDRELNNRQSEATSLSVLGRANYHLNDYQKAVEYYGLALKIANQVKDRYLEGKILGWLGNIYHKIGEYRKALEFFERDFEIASQFGDIYGEARANWNKGLILESLGMWDEAEVAMQVLVELETRKGDRYLEIHRQRLEKLRKKIAQGRKEK